MPINKEQLLVEVEDLLRNAPTASDVVNRFENVVPWRGRCAAVIRAWDFRRSAEIEFCQQKLESLSINHQNHGLSRMLAMLHEARHALQMETLGPLTVAVGQGKVFDY